MHELGHTGSNTRYFQPSIMFVAQSGVTENAALYVQQIHIHINTYIHMFSIRSPLGVLENSLYVYTHVHTRIDIYL